MNKAIKIKHFNLVSYDILLKVVSKYIELYGKKRLKKEYEKHQF